jgi:hypothetical protein
MHSLLFVKELKDALSGEEHFPTYSDALHDPYSGYKVFFV